jgi:hypothetical protein
VTNVKRRLDSRTESKVRRRLELPVTSSPHSAGLDMCQDLEDTCCAAVFIVCVSLITLLATPTLCEVLHFLQQQIICMCEVARKILLDVVSTVLIDCAVKSS